MSIINSIKNFFFSEGDAGTVVAMPNHDAVFDDMDLSAHVAILEMLLLEHASWRVQIKRMIHTQARNQSMDDGDQPLILSLGVWLNNEATILAVYDEYAPLLQACDRFGTCIVHIMKMQEQGQFLDVLDVLRHGYVEESLALEVALEAMLSRLRDESGDKNKH